LFLAGGLLLASNVIAAEAPQALAPPAATPHTDTPLLALEARALQAVCGSKCHTLAIVLGAPPASYDVWHDIVQKMLDRGARASDDELQDVMDYLHQTQTLIDVNVADADELQFVLDIPEVQAQAIVERRARKKFSDLEDLKSVKGLDAAILDSKARLIAFQH
jgi:hypothetical protein